MQTRQIWHGTNACEIVLTGSFTFTDHAEFRAVLRLMGSAELKKLTLNFADVEFIDSAGLGMLLLAREEAEKKHIGLLLKDAQGQVRKMFSISEFDKIFTITGA